MAMRNALALTLLGGLLAACSPGGDPEMEASGGSAGEMGPGFCEAPPSDPEQMAQWQDLCNPDGGR